jgi:hypothetical protein
LVVLVVEPVFAEPWPEDFELPWPPQPATTAPMSVSTMTRAVTL